MVKARYNGRRIDAFDFPPGTILAGKYAVVAPLGAGWESEVYQIRELSTGIMRAGKLFYPQRNVRGNTARFHAKKLHKLRHCPILIQYLTSETVPFDGVSITLQVSELIEGEPLTEFLQRQPGKRIAAFQGLHLLHALAGGVECIHNAGEYHGDLHAGNVIVQRHGISFDLKLLDLFQWGRARKENLHDDVCDLVRLFYDAIGGARHYARQPREIKAICCGLKRSLILSKFRTAAELKRYLENLQWT